MAVAKKIRDAQAKIEPETQYEPAKAFELLTQIAKESARKFV